MSFTRAAAHEIASRNVPLPRDNVGTLHAFAYRAIGRPHMVEDDAGIKQFNEGQEAYRISGPAVEKHEGMMPLSTRGDEVRAEYSRLRNLCVPREAWPASVLAFAAVWEDYKAATGGIDFADMIEVALNDTGSPEQCPQVIVCDEAQDFSRLELQLVWRWAQNVNKVVMALDTDQVLYSWAGSDPAVFLEIEPREQKVLAQSYRVPRAVHSVAMEWIRQVQGREDVEYYPRPADGEVAMSDATFLKPEKLLEDVLAALEEMAWDEDREEWRPATCMIMGSCSYMIEPLVRLLRAEAIPFGNPWRRKQGAWNPLAKRGEGSTVDAVRAFVAPHQEGATRIWTAEQVAAWAKITKGVFRRYGKAAVTDLDEDASEAEVVEALTAHMRAEHLDGAWALPPECLDWLARNLLQARRGPGEYALQVLANQGVGALEEEPRLFVGTIHSFKGAQADHVWVYPDLSKKGFHTYRQDDTDSVLRQYYVAMTRAREKLTLCAAAGREAVEWLA